MYPSIQSLAPSTASRVAAATSAGGSLKRSHRNTGTSSRRINEIRFGIVQTRELDAGTRPGYGLQPGGAAFGAGIGGGAVPAVHALDRVRDSGAVPVALRHFDRVAARDELVDPSGIEVILDRDLSGARIDREPRRADRGLRVVVVDDHAHQQLRVRL